MKKLFLPLFLIVILSAVPALAGDAPNLEGAWVCQSTTVAGIKAGIYENKEAGSTLVIEDQKGRVFTGYKRWTLKGESFTEKIVGGIAADGELYIAEENDGTLHGDYDEAGGRMLLFYVESGPDAKVLQGVYKKAQ
ncbi:hypothetical protein [Pseudodesulfovibrio indicus]|uniref:hypothetical protein n=1 Tax=Pseudodesulfovibrio indicus TaxID=1716143 RepID=UPI00292D772D|nr:hypothetical protein [Pseudodesulfovibrio indicus]